MGLADPKVRPPADWQPTPAAFSGSWSTWAGRAWALLVSHPAELEFDRLGLARARRLLGAAPP